MSVTRSPVEEMEHDRRGTMVVLHPVDTSVLHPTSRPGDAGQERGWRRWATPAALLAVAALALALRVWRLDALGFNSDEAVYAGQAASLAGNPNYAPFFPVFRAHPMLFQTLLSPFFRAGEVDVAGRVVVAALGVATVLAVHLLGARLYSRRVGLLAALFMAVMPYHVIVTRQVLLDGPMVLFATLTLYCLVRFVQGQQVIWYVATGAMLGVTMLTKETSIVLAGGVYAFLALTPMVRRPVRMSLLAVAAMAAVFLTHPVSQALAGRSQTGKSYLVWQLFRRPNHSMGFYLETVPPALGLLVVAAAVGGLWWLRRHRSWRETLLLSWIAAPVVFFQLWPVKGFQYLLPAAAPVAMLAARALIGMPVPDRIRRLLHRAHGSPGTDRSGVVRAAVIAVVALSLLAPSWNAVNRADNSTFLAGSGGVPGGREAGRWLAANTPEGSVVLTLGPSMANIIQYYGHRRSYGLSVSPNPLRRNPSYEPLPNPDWWLRHNDLQYVVWDSFSAGRSAFFSERLMVLIRRYHGRVVHTEYVDGADSTGARVPVPVIIIYEVRP
ncbi:glycosyltransferase family 39 protein [Micromonospora sp. DR5-3]|uniref:glycosyltransferase family 39 protein n=1 Tax=unclassified Micromonospora TaxID=2617518 RepID=UPI001652821B|nr:MULTISPECIES: glycosyltransferase family 39 protein [unclassified Micromonospora]MCW3813900.1 glycosyltransferase family 39 protein [Micromonospora sp. DR5-3]